MYGEFMSDQELVKACLSGDEDAYQQIMQRYSGKAMALALNMLRQREDAEDVCQDAFVKAFINLEKYDPQQDFKNWFYTVLYRRCLDHMRKRKRFYGFIGKLRHEPLAGDARVRLNPGRRNQLDPRVLKGLSPKQRIALVLWANEGYTGEEIAAVLRCSPSTARVNLYKARKKIKAMLEGEDVAMQNG
jgi:RNA polymerase sigma-70 factor (ECF subfamily)